MKSLSAYSSSSSEEAPPSPDGLTSSDFSHQKRQRSTVDMPVVISTTAPERGVLIHVHVPVQHKSIKCFVATLIGEARLKMVGSCLKTPLTELQEYHVSISRPTIIPSSHIASLLKGIHSVVSQCQHGHINIQCGVQAFLSNKSKRLFLAAPVITRTSNVIMMLIEKISRLFEERNLPPFFADPKPHMSFAWTEMIDILPLYNTPNISSPPHADLTMSVNKVICTVGNSNYYFTLANT